MQHPKVDNAGVKIPPPLVFVGMIFAAYVLSNLYPLSISLPWWTWHVGIGLVLLSMFGLFTTAILFRKYQTEIAPWKPTQAIIKKGPFRYSRNPIYLCMSTIVIGMGLIKGSLWMVLSFLPALFIVYHTAIKKEERYLERKFRKKYLNYKSEVRRWL